MIAFGGGDGLAVNGAGIARVLVDVEALGVEVGVGVGAGVPVPGTTSMISGSAANPTVGWLTIFSVSIGVLPVTGSYTLTVA